MFAPNVVLHKSVDQLLFQQKFTCPEGMLKSGFGKVGVREFMLYLASRAC